MKTKLEVIRINNDVIATSSSECEFLEAEHFKIEGVQEFPGEGFTGIHYIVDTPEKINRSYVITQFEESAGAFGWYHMDPDSGRFIWCNHQEHEDFINKYTWN